MSANQDVYLEVLKASYDYEPQAEDEIAVKENQILFLLEKADDEWWRVKCKTDTPDNDGLTGLVPAAYVEPAEHISIVKALYEYEASSSGELSIKEDEMLLVFAKEEDWWLVQSQSGGAAGYVPATYVEEAGSEEEAAPASSISQIIVPPSPPRPVSTYVDPADRVAASKAKADDIQTWSVSEVDKKGKKKKGTLGVGNGAVFFASESDKTPVQKWQTGSISSTRIDKSKHVLIDISDPPTSLHFNAHSKDVAEAIVSKLESSKAISLPDHALEPPSAPAGRISPKVHFAEEEPEVIPPRESSEEALEETEQMEAQPEEEEEAELPPQGYDQDDVETEHDADQANGDVDIAVALYDFSADGEDELSVAEGEQLVVLERDSEEWWKCRNADGADGVVPASYLEMKSGGSGSAQAVKAQDDTAAHEAAAQAQTQRLEQERAQRERAEKAAKKREADQRAQAAAAAEAERKRKEKERERERKEREAEEERRKAAERQRRDMALTKKEQDEEPQRRSSKASSASGEAFSSGRTSSDKRGPPPEKTRIWRDRSGQFRVEAALLAYQNGKLRLHKANGVVIEVPSEKMSVEDMKYVEKVMSKKSPSVASRPSASLSDDDEPLAVRRQSLQPPAPQRAAAPKKGPSIDWFEFFLSAGCDVDDCTRYASSFERDKIDQAILPDITESTMRSLGLREGDIIRVKKVIEKSQPKLGNGSDAASQEYAGSSQEEKGVDSPVGNSKSASPAPNLFAGPNGALKNVRRGRPQPSKSLPPSSVDLNAIASASDQIQRVGTPASSSSTPLQPPRSNSAAPIPGGFDDNAWTNRPSSTKPTAPRTSSVTPAPPPPDSLPARAPSAPLAGSSQSQNTGGSGSSLANRTESDIFNQLARLSELRNKSPPVPSPLAAPSNLAPVPGISPSVSYQSGLGMRSSPAPIGQHLHNQQSGLLPPPQQQNVPRGPFAPVPLNQALLQPLIPTNTGIDGFVSTHPSNTTSPFQSQPQQPSFLNVQPTGFAGSPQLMSQPTGFPNSSPMFSQPTGFPGSFGGYDSNPSIQNNSGFGPLQTNPTGFNPGFGQMTSPMAPHAAPTTKDTSPANIFAQMKSGTFASGNESSVQPADKYDALRPNPTPLTLQATGWGYQGAPGYQGFPGYQR